MSSYVYEPAKHLPPLPLDMLRAFVASQTGGGLEGLDWPVLLQIWETLLATDQPSEFPLALAQGGVIYEENGRYGHRALDGVFEELGDVSPMNPKDLPLGLLGWKLVGTPEATELIEQAAACWGRFNKTFKLDSANPKEVTKAKVENWQEKDPQPCIHTEARLATTDFQSDRQVFRVINGLGYFFSLKNPSVAPDQKLRVPSREECAPATLIAVQSVYDTLFGVFYSKAWGCQVFQLAPFAGAVCKGLPLYGTADLRVPVVVVFESDTKCYGQLTYRLSPGTTSPMIFEEDRPTSVNGLKRYSLQDYGPSLVETFKGSENVAVYLTSRHFEDRQPIWVTFPSKSRHGRIPAYDRASHLKVLNRLWRFYGMRHLVYETSLLEPERPLNLPPVVLAGTATKKVDLIPMAWNPEARQICLNLLKHFGGTMLRVEDTYAVFRPAGKHVASHRQVRTPTFGLLPGYYDLPMGLKSLKPDEMSLSQTPAGFRVTSSGVSIDVPRIPPDKVTGWMMNDGYTPDGQVGKELGEISYKGWKKLQELSSFTSDDPSRNLSGVGFIRSNGREYLAATDGRQLMYTPVNTQRLSEDFDVSGMFGPRFSSREDFWDIKAVDVQDAAVVDIMFMWGTAGWYARILSDSSGKYQIFEWTISGETYQVWSVVSDFPDVSSFLDVAPGTEGKASQVTLSAKAVRDLVKYLRSLDTKIHAIHVSFSRDIKFWDGFSDPSGAARAVPFTASGDQASGPITHTPLVTGIAPKMLAKMLKAMDGHPVTFMVGGRQLSPIYMDSPELCGVIMPVRID